MSTLTISLDVGWCVPAVADEMDDVEKGWVSGVVGNGAIVHDVEDCEERLDAQALLVPIALRFKAPRLRTHQMV